jgi:peptidyl-dipeptidase Dcp
VLLAVIATIALVVVKTGQISKAMNPTTELSTNENPLLMKWEGPYGGVPPFDRVQIALFKPALETAMAEQLAETDAIAKNTAAPDFENTIAALERTGKTLNRVITVYGVWGATMASPEYQAVQREMAPRLAAFNDQITQNEALFKRIEAVYNPPRR